MAMFGAYLDASGVTADQPYIVMAGFAASVDKWISFESDWEGLLNTPRYKARLWERNGRLYAHARKMRQWPMAIREAFYAEANYLLSKTVNFAVVCWIKHADYKAVYRDYPLTQKDSVYGMSFRGALVATCANVAEEHPSEQVSFVLEEGDANQGGAKTIFDATLKDGNVMAEARKQYPVGALAIAPKEQYGALQAADMHAYCTLSHLKSPLAKGKGEPKEYFGDINLLLSGLQYSVIEIDKPMLVNLKKRKLEYYANRKAFGAAKYGQKTKT